MSNIHIFGRRPSAPAEPADFWSNMNLGPGDIARDAEAIKGAPEPQRTRYRLKWSAVIPLGVVIGWALLYVVWRMM